MKFTKLLLIGYGALWVSTGIMARDPLKIGEFMGLATAYMIPMLVAVIGYDIYSKARVKKTDAA